MPRLELTREIPVAATAVRAVLRGALEELSERSRAAELALTVKVGAAGKPQAEISVPIRLSVDPEDGAAEKTRFEVKPHGAGPFPAFAGTLEAEELEPAKSVVILRGTYDVPWGPIGAALDATAFHGVAEQSLATLLERIADAAYALLGRQAERERRQTRGT